ncbi:hypothetical protein [Deinococcus roseus]|uniref:Uncharacterized protein n=1 Tax=Deinococcus roseus TaxID=392414 RepID=A0ABQ2D8D0_9DEIO|nr:hypothetical protein [Deinococcus roseus]GGJ49662.1 hypothetical protein GCM10008938_39540 [Deinococcus roseus]
MKHEKLPIHHVYQATDAVIFQIRRLSDLGCEYGAGAAGFALQDLQVAGRRFLQTLQAEELHSSLRDYPHVVAETILEEMTRQGQHMLLVLHHKNDPTYGWKCWLPRIKIFEVTEVLQSSGLQIDVVPLQHRSAD